MPKVYQSIASVSRALRQAASSILSIPFYILLRPRKQALIRFFVMVLIISGALLLLYYEDYLFGGRGLLLAAKSALILDLAGLKELYEIYFGMFLVLPLAVAGIMAQITMKRMLAFNLSLFILWLAHFLFGERFSDVPVQLFTYALLCMISGEGAVRFATVSSKKDEFSFVWIPLVISVAVLFMTNFAIRDRLVVAEISISKNIMIGYLFLLMLFALTGLLWRVARAVTLRNYMSTALLIAILGGNIFWSIRLVNLKTGVLLEYKNTFLELNAVGSPDYVVVGSWNEGILFEHYVFRKSYTDRWISTEFLYGELGGSLPLEATILAWNSALADRREIFVLNDNPLVFDDLQEAGYVLEPFRNIWQARPAE